MENMEEIGCCWLKRLCTATPGLLFRKALVCCSLFITVVALKVTSDRKPTVGEAVQRWKGWPWPEKLITDILSVSLCQRLPDSSYSDTSRNKHIAKGTNCGEASGYLRYIWKQIIEDFLGTSLAGPTRKGEDVLQSGEPTVFSVSPCSETGSAANNDGDAEWRMKATTDRSLPS